MSSKGRFAERACVSLFLWFAALPTVSAVTFDDPDNFAVKRQWSGSSLGLPGNLGAMLFASTGESVYVIGNSEAVNGALYAVPVTRELATNEVTDLGPADQVTLVFSGNPSGRGLDAGLEAGPEGTLFYTYWPSHRLGERPGGVVGAESLYNMADVGLPSSVAGLAFSPHITDPNTGFGMMQVSVWVAGGLRNLYNVPLLPLGGGLFEPQQVETFVTLPRQGTGAIQYIPSGPFAGNMMYVNWDYGEILILSIDQATGFPIDDATGLPTLATTNPRVQRFASGLGVGPWGLEFDPLSNDFFVSTWGENPYNTIIQIGGAGLPPPVEAGVTSLTSAAADLTIRWYGPAGWIHVLEHSLSMLPANWEEIYSVPDALAINERTIPIPPDDRTGFYRVKCIQQ